MLYLKYSRFIFAVLALLLAVDQSGATAFAQAVAPPNVVKEPTGLNLGLTSFYDAFGSTNPGFVLIDYGRLFSYNAIVDGDGKKVPAFNKPHVDVFANIIQPIWVSRLRLGDGVFGVNALIPLISFDSSFKQPGASLRGNTFNVGDVTFGPFYQHAPIIVGGRPVLVWRAEFDAIGPTGSFDKSRDLNQGSGFWSLTPYITVTALPTSRWEVTARTYYIYNFQTKNIAHPPPIPGLVFRNGQAGQAAWVNFDTSYEIFKGIRPGISGFYFKQFTEDRTNGSRLDGSLNEQLYAGPGLSLSFGRSYALNLNVDLPISVRNSASGPAFTYQFIHLF